MASVRVIDSRKIYSGNVSVRMDKFMLNKKIIEKEIIEHVPSVGIVPIIDSDVILVTQYRRAAEKTLLEIPAGKIEKGETPKQAAVREMAEEIGYAGRLAPLLQCYLAPGYDTEFMSMYIATGLKKIKKGMLDDDENINIRRMHLDAALEKCFNGEIQDCKTIAALLAYVKLQPV